MSILECNRKGCESIMCDRYSEAHGYICYECFEELVKSGIETDIYEFMRKLKKEASNSPKTAFERFDRIFPL